MTFEQYWHSCSWKQEYSMGNVVEIRGIMREKGM
jgi:hypothetical protein